MKSIAQRLEEHASPTPSKWRELFDFLEIKQVLAPTFAKYCHADAGQDGGIRYEPKAIG